MDNSKVIRGAVNSGRYTVTAPIVKEDYGLYLQIEGVELPQTYEVDFSNDEHHGTSVTMIGNSDGVLIPHQFIDTGKDIFAFLYHVGEDYGKTVYKFRIPNKLRPDRTNEEPTPEEQSTIDQAITALNSAVAQTAQDVIDADASAQSASADAERAEEARTDAQNYATQAEQARDDAQTYANNASASATASAQSASQSAQIKSDVEDLVDDAQTSADASAQSASASATSATQAQGYAQSASASAQSASGYASSAGGYAQTASAKAQDASTSAQTATQKATESAQSASQSAQIKSDVEDLVDDAQASANASAQSASASANSAATAQGFAQSASASAQSASGYASNAQSYSQTASAKAQDASGYAQTATQKATESAQSASQALTYKTDAESAKTASQTAQGLAESARDDAISAKDDAEDARDEAQSIVDGISGKVEQIDSNTERIESLEDDRYKPYVTDTASGSIASFPDGADDIPLKSLVVDINPIQDLSNGDPSPENICPISGWDEVKVTRTGKNLLDSSNALTETQYGITFTPNSDGSITVNGTATQTVNYLMIRGGIDFPNGTYVISGCPAGGGSSTYRFRTDTQNGGSRGNDTGSGATFTVDDGKLYNTFITIWNGATVNNLVFHPQICLASASNPTDYEPYSGDTYTIEMSTEAGTVYGGKLDVLSGVLTVDRAIVDLGTLTWDKKASGVFFSWSLKNLVKAVVASQTANAKCTTLKIGTYNDVYSNARLDNAISVGGASQLGAHCSAFANNNEFKTAMSGVQFCYELATPIEIQLTPNQINSLYGVNNLWADSGDAEVEYRADTKLFIERLTAPDSADMIADSNITSGQYFMVGNSLYKATANIANGSVIVVGTNCIRKSLSEALNEINA